MSETEPFYVPLGDDVLLDGAGSLQFTDEICRNSGGPSQKVVGHVWLTRELLAFRPLVGMPYPQQVTLRRTNVSGASCVQPKLFGVLKFGMSQLVLLHSELGRSVRYAFEVEMPERWLNALGEPLRVQERSARDLVQAALKAGERIRGRYTAALETLSFPRGYWHTEDTDGRDEVLAAGLKALDVDVPTDFVSGLDLNVEVGTDPEDYEEGPGTEEWGRREQIRRVCEAVNAIGGERRFYEYAEDLPGWTDFGEPLWLWLSPWEDEELRRLGVVREKRSSAK
jgi:hypothetical protein